MNDSTWAVVTGASSGIGREFARLFAQDNMNVVLCARNKDDLDALATELKNTYGTQARVYAGDLSQIEKAKDLYAFVSSQKLDVSYLINNAGFGDYGLFADAQWKKLHDMINLNVIALTYLAQAFGKDMGAKGQGHILNVASTAAFLPGPNMAVYYATKAYVLSLSQAFGNELAGSGVSVTALCPGPTATRFALAANADQSAVFKGRTSPTAEQVATYGYKAMMAGKAVAVHGQTNRVLIFLTRFIPRQALAKMARRFQG